MCQRFRTLYLYNSYFFDVCKVFFGKIIRFARLNGGQIPTKRGRCRGEKETGRICASLEGLSGRTAAGKSRNLPSCKLHLDFRRRIRYNIYVIHTTEYAGVSEWQTRGTQNPLRDFPCLCEKFTSVRWILRVCRSEISYIPPEHPSNLQKPVLMSQN